MTPNGGEAFERTVNGAGRRSGRPLRGRSRDSLTRLAPIVALLGLVLAGCGSTPVTTDVGASAPAATATVSPAPGATFTVGDIDIAPDRSVVLMQDTVRVSAQVQNTGAIAGTFEASLAVDGATRDSQDVVLGVGQTQTVRFELEAGEPGDHTITIGSSAASLTVSAPVAVFEVSGLDVAPGQGEILAGDDVEFVARVDNAGNLHGTYQAELSVDGVVAARQDVALDAGQSGTVHLAVRAGLPGDYDVALADLHRTLTVPAPAAFEIGPPVLWPNPGETGGRLDVVAPVTNSGGLAGTVSVSLTVDGKVKGKQEATVAAGQTEAVDFSIPMPRAGRHTVAANGISTELVVWSIARPANGAKIVNKVAGGRGVLRVENSGDQDAVVVLARSSSPSRTLLAVYVRAHKSTTLRNVKDGTYVVFFRRGERWDTWSRAFTSAQESRRFESTLRFSTRRTATRITWSIWTITLQVASGGNAPTDAVADEEFPAVR